MRNQTPKYRTIDEEYEVSWDRIPYIAPGVNLCEKYDPIFAIYDQAAADCYLEQCVVHMMQAHGVSREEATKIEKMNIGYWAANGGDDVRERVERLFDTEHPVLGKFAETGPLTPQQCYEAGRAFALKDTKCFPTKKSPTSSTTSSSSTTSTKTGRQ